MLVPTGIGRFGSRGSVDVVVKTEITAQKESNSYPANSQSL
jgi:hypothetical protein